MDVNSEARLKKLVRLRAPLKGKITNLKNYLNKPLSEQIRGELIEKCEGLKGIREAFETIQQEIESLVTDECFIAEEKEREHFEEELCSTLAKAKSYINGDQFLLMSVQSMSSLNLTNQPNAVNLDNQPSTSHISSVSPLTIQNQTITTANAPSQFNNSSESNYRVPQADLPKFEGSYTKWPAFSDHFKSAIHNNTKLSDTEKLMYLKSCLVGRAADKIDSLETTAANYQVAWSILDKFYNDPAAIIDNRVRALIDLKPCHFASESNLSNILDNVTKHYRALEALNKPFLEAFPIYLVVSKLDNESQIKWKEEIQGNTFPTMNQLLEFLHSRRKVLETYKPTRFEKSDKHLKNNTRGFSGQNSANHKTYPLNEAHSTYLNTAQLKPFCHLCKGSHFTQSCERLTKANISERINLIKNAGLCYNCLRSNHKIDDCKSSNCKTCKKKHHSLLHIDDERPNQSTHVNTFYSRNNDQIEKLLPSAVVHIMDQEGTPYECRVLLDSCSQPHLLTERMASKLKLQKREINIPLGAVNSLSSYITHMTHTTVQSRINDFVLSLDFLIVKEVNELLPSREFNKSKLNIPHNIQLADPSFHLPNKIDGIIGAEYFFQLLRKGQIKLPGQNIFLQNTVFGWILSGKLASDNLYNKISCHLLTTPLNEQLEKFWLMESYPKRKFYTVEENECETHYQKHTTRNLITGKYCVKLPFRENVGELGESYSHALKRFHALERNFARKPDYKKLYIENLRSYEINGYMSESNSASSREGYYLPHHAVTKNTSLTTQLRVVFDGSAKTATGTSLNDALMVGPTIQDDLFSLLVRFRSHTYVLTADIEKMYLQTMIHPEDRKYQKILWRENSSQPIKTYELNTATFGTSAAPFLAIRSLHQLASDEEHLFPRAAAVLKNDFYVDDMLTGTATWEEAEKLRDDLIKLTRRGGLNLRKWASNDSHLIQSLSDCSNEPFFQLNLDSVTKTLGIQWNWIQDSITFSISLSKESKTVTKRVILSQISQLFDPLGLLSPVTVYGKILMQKLWLLNLGWDSAVPTEIYKEWNEFRNQLPMLSSLNFNRKFFIENNNALQLHGFCDASEKAYGACIYIRSTSLNGISETHLVTSKSRVSPLKTISLPRLELSAALLLTQLYEATFQALKHLKFEKVIFWSDSTITLHWIKTPLNSLKTFVKNRVSEIVSTTSGIHIHEWRHIRSEFNPADLVSRGSLPKEFINALQWKYGPRWINKDETLWPQSILEVVHLPELKPNETSLLLNEISIPPVELSNGTTTIKDVMVPLTSGDTVKENKVDINILSHFSSSDNLKRFIAFCKRTTQYIKTGMKPTGNLTINELKGANITMIKLIQADSFNNELKTLKSKSLVEGRLANLAPFIDEEGILRVGGRLNKAHIPFSQRHPALLPQRHHFTNIIIREEHIKMMHGGTQATLNSIHQNFWIVNGRNTVRNIIRKCVTCSRASPIVLQYLMGSLPTNRLSLNRPFLVTGIDYCGPFYIKEKIHRNRNKIKIYVAIFVCFATKAVHVELVGDLTTEAFLAALRRFFSRRGLSSDLYTDNATNFVGARNEINEIQELLASHEHNELVKRSLANDNIAWHVIPPRSPHFGGLWEAAVKSFKHHFVRIVGETLLSYENFLTLTTEIEAILNSRPLTPISSDPNDLSALTPGHFLIGDSLRSMPDRNMDGIPARRLPSWQHVQLMRQHFWNRWYKEYLNTLNVRKKWHNGGNNEIKVGNLVTIKEDNTPPLKWTLGRIIAVHPGSDNIIRVVTVKTYRGEYKRSVKGIAPLPITVNDEDHL